MEALDLKGQRFGRLVVLEKAESRRMNNNKTKTQWVCRCECGNIVTVRTDCLRYGNTKSCGCFAKERYSYGGKIKAKHGMAKTQLYNIWVNMKQRCNNPNNKSYKDYGKRGIKICDEWNENFQSFMSWALANGYEENLSIERKDVNKGYTADNCCWISLEKQARNKRNNIYLEDMYGNKVSLAEKAELSNISIDTIYYRIDKGWSLNKAIHTPLKKDGTTNKPVEKLKNGKVVGLYKSVKEASEKNGINNNYLCKCLKSGQLCKGFLWRYRIVDIKIKYFDGCKPLGIIDKGDWIDLAVNEDVYMQKGDFRLLHLGVAMQIPEGYEAIIAPRSSTFKKYKILQANSIGVVDNSYCGDNDEWCFPAFATEEVKIEKGTRICQFRIFENQPAINLNAVETLGNEDRGGFGSSGVK